MKDQIILKAEVCSEQGLERVDRVHLIRKEAMSYSEAAYLFLCKQWYLGKTQSGNKCHHITWRWWGIACLPIFQHTCSIAASSCQWHQQCVCFSCQCFGGKKTALLMKLEVTIKHCKHYIFDSLFLVVNETCWWHDMVFCLVPCIHRTTWNWQIPEYVSVSSNLIEANSKNRGETEPAAKQRGWNIRLIRSHLGVSERNFYLFMCPWV